MYTSEVIVNARLKSKFITIPKKATAKICKEYRTISLTSKLFKMCRKIIHTCIYKKCENYFDNI